MSKKNIMLPFNFYTGLEQVTLTGNRASTIAELSEGMKNASASALYYHTHRFLQQHIAISPEPPNDFAYWIGNVLNIEWLSEQLSSVNLVQFHDIEDVRKTYIRILGEYIRKQKHAAKCPEGQEFHFMGCRTFVIKIGYTAGSLTSFRECLSTVDINSIIYHIFDVRLHQGKPENDFSSWFESIGKSQLASEVRRLDPYTYTLEGLRRHIITLVSRYEKN